MERYVLLLALSLTAAQAVRSCNAGRLGQAGAALGPNKNYALTRQAIQVTSQACGSDALRY